MMGNLPLFIFNNQIGYVDIKTWEDFNYCYQSI